MTVVETERFSSWESELYMIRVTIRNDISVIASGESDDVSEADDHVGVMQAMDRCLKNYELDMVGAS